MKRRKTDSRRKATQAKDKKLKEYMFVETINITCQPILAEDRLKAESLYWTWFNKHVKINTFDNEMLELRVYEKDGKGYWNDLDE
jgi:hypothetical protein